MDRSAFIAYARRQLADIEAILGNHVAADNGCCSCGRPRPCPHGERLLRERDHYRRRLAEA